MSDAMDVVEVEEVEPMDVAWDFIDIKLEQWMDIETPHSRKAGNLWYHRIGGRVHQEIRFPRASGHASPDAVDVHRISTSSLEAASEILQTELSSRIAFSEFHYEGAMDSAHRGWTKLIRYKIREISRVLNERS